MEEVQYYSHIVIAFAVSYTWAPSKNICSATCEIPEPLICNNSPNPTLISQWQAAGKKVILSFGGGKYYAILTFFERMFKSVSRILIFKNFSRDGR
jgi:hypothetical protein